MIMMCTHKYVRLENTLPRHRRRANTNCFYQARPSRLPGLPMYQKSHLDRVPSTHDSSRYRQLDHRPNGILGDSPFVRYGSCSLGD